MNTFQHKNTPGIYIIQSQKNFRYYIGSTGNVEERLKYHNNGRVKATKLLSPWKIKFFQPCPNITVARQIEYQLKKLKRRDYIEGIIKKQKIKGKIALLLS
ncbi:MAG: GIY-YIG nuclease family protein [bacterium]